MKKKDTLKDPNKPKRPPNSFFLFMEEFQKTYKEKHLSVKIYHPALISRDAGEKWKCMLEAEKAPYIAKAKEMMAEYKKKMQVFNGGGLESRLEDLQEIDEEEFRKSPTLPPSPRKRKSPPPPPTKKACASSDTEATHELDQLAAERFLKFKEAIIKDYLVSKEFGELKSECAGKAIQEFRASKAFQKELDEHLEKYKGCDEHKKVLAQHLERYKKSEDYQKALTQHLEMYKKSEKYKKELAKHLERYKKCEGYKKALTEHLEMHKKSEEYKKELAEHLKRYKKCEEYKKELSEHLKRYKKCEEYKKELTEHLKRYKKSEEYKKELADHLEKYKGSKEHKHIAVQEVVGSFIQGLPVTQRRVYDLLRNRFPDLDIASCGLPAETDQDPTGTSHRSSLFDEIKFLLLLLPFLLPVVLRPTEDDEDTLNLREFLTKKVI